jgi:phage repressor protein C with HTH and peptisase S24 domain
MSSVFSRNYELFFERRCNPVSISARIFHLMELKGITQAELARKTGISRNTITDWKKKGSNPSADRVACIAEQLGVTSDFLLTGNLANEDKARLGNFTSEEIELINYFRVLPEREKDRTLGNIEGKAEVYSENKVEPKQQGAEISDIIQFPRNGRTKEGSVENEIEFIEMKVYDQPAAAGLGNYLDEYVPYQEINFDASEVPYSADFGIRIHGDSMEPDILDGSIVWVQERIQIESGQIGVFILDGESYCKKLKVDQEKRIVSLVSINEAYKPIEVDEESRFKTVGRVLLS